VLAVHPQRGRLKPELVVITEPTNLNIYRGHRGRMEIRVEVKGRSCHGSAPERGDNAIYKIARIALEIEKLNERLRGDPFLGKGTVTISEVKSSSPSLCAVADGAGIHLDRRLTPARPRRARSRRCRTRQSAPAIPTRRSRAQLRGGRLHRQGLPDREILPDLGARRNSPYLKDAVAAYTGRAGQAAACGQVDLQHQRHRHGRHEGASRRSASGRATRSTRTPPTRPARSST
jgi:hypothetical protein